MPQKKYPVCIINHRISATQRRLAPHNKMWKSARRRTSFFASPGFHTIGKRRIDTKNGMPACPNAGGPIIIRRRAAARRGPGNTHPGFHKTRRTDAFNASAKSFIGPVKRIGRRAVAMRQPYKRVPNVTFVIFGRSKRDGDGVFTAAAGHPDAET